MRARPIRFGVFCSPWHTPGRNPTLHLQQDLQLCEHLDRLGFDEVWWGEHHSGGFEIVPAPEIFIAAAAERTRHIRLGTGVISVPYHHPMVIADRITFVDHLTRGRAMFGFGPGSLVQDSEMMGLDVSEARARLEEGVEAIVRLLEDDEPVTMRSEWFTLDEAKLNLHPYSWPRMELATASIRSPSGPRSAGRFGLGLLSLAASEGPGFEFLKDTWSLVEEEATLRGRGSDRVSWRVVSTVHIADSVEEAIEQTRWGFDDMLRFFAAVGVGPPAEMDVENFLESTTHESRIRAMNEAQRMAIGTPDMVIDLIERLQEQSGGFGTFLIRVPDLARFEDRLHSLELFAHEVMPHFQGSTERTDEAWKRFYGARTVNAKIFREAQDQFAARHAAEREALAHPAVEP